MIAEPIIAFFIIRYLRKILQKTSALPAWHRPLNVAMYAVLLLFVLQFVFSAQTITTWIWHILMLVLIGIIFKQREFSPARNLVIAVSPLILVGILTDVIKLLPDKLYEAVRTPLGFALPFSIIWMIVMLLIFNKQRKVLEKEQKKLHLEEEQKRIIATRKAELEVMVAERTSEIMQQKNELEHALEELRTTQTQLIQSEKMASLGELTAGIAHEIQNPLNFVNNFSEVNVELADELKGELSKLELTGDKKSDIENIVGNIIQNQEKIIHHGRRADAIVKSMLQHSRVSTGQKELTDINTLTDEYLRLSYHGIRAKDKTFNATLQTDFNAVLEKVNIVPQDIGRVLLNLFNNAFYAVSRKNVLALKDGQKFEPTITVKTKKENDKVIISVRDNGDGIPENIVDKIFQPFFATKPTGQGTGLGLSLSYDIIKAHGGEIKVETKEGEGSKFAIELPV